MTENVPNLSDISMVIRQKERELHEIHERRCQQLEKVIEERDKTIQDSNKKFSQLREDFKYNLSLLEARDNEIRRLEGVSHALHNQVQTLQTEKSSVMHRLEKIQQREQERKDRSKGDAALQKQMLMELQQEVEAVKWTTSEEIKSKQNEVDKCREEIRRMHTERDNALSLQRRDMTTAFEQLVAQREGAFSQRENEIASQVGSLEKRIEAVQTENIRFKSELSETARQRDKMSLDLERKDEMIRQLKWKLDDSSETWKHREDALERSLHEALNEVNLCRDSLMKQIGDSQLEIDRGRMDLRRERDLREATEDKNKEMRTMMEERLKEVRAAADERAKQSIGLSEERLSELKKDQNMQLERLTSQVAGAEDTINRLKDQLTAAESKLNTASVSHAAEVRSLREAISRDEAAAASYKDELSILEKRLQSNMDESSRRVSALEAEVAEKEQEKEKATNEWSARVALLEGKVAEMKSSQASELELHKAAMDAEQIINSEEYESSRFHQHLQELQGRVMSVSSERDHLRAELQEFKAQLEEQTMECSALRLRLQLNESNFAQSQRGLAMNTNKAASLAHPSALSPMFRREHGNNSSRMDFSSPLFTEDQGSISLPASPDGRLLNSGPSSRQHHDERHGYGYEGHPEDLAGREGFYPKAQSGVPPLHAGGAPVRRHSDPNASTDSLVKLAEDNNRLREVIKDMRREMEMMPQTVADSGHRGEKDRIIREQRERIEDLETQLSQAVKEVARLRAERKKLMDTGNELRASLFQLQVKSGGSPHGDAFSPSYPRGAPSPRQDSRRHEHDDAHSQNSGASGHHGYRGHGHHPRSPENPWARGDGEMPPPPPPSHNKSHASGHSHGNPPYPQHATNTIGQPPSGSRLSEGGRGSRLQPDDGLDGEPLNLSALPLPPGRHSSNRTTESQRRVLTRLKQTQMRSQEPRKVMNYAIGANQS